MAKCYTKQVRQIFRPKPIQVTQQENKLRVWVKNTAIMTIYEKHAKKNYREENLNARFKHLQTHCRYTCVHSHSQAYWSTCLHKFAHTFCTIITYSQYIMCYHADDYIIIIIYIIWLCYLITNVNDSDARNKQKYKNSLSTVPTRDRDTGYSPFCSHELHGRLRT